MKFKKNYKRKQIKKSRKLLAGEYYLWKANGSPYHDFAMETVLNGCVGCERNHCDKCPMYGWYPAWRMPDGVILWSGGDGIDTISELIEVAVDEEELQHICAKCESEMRIVRPGKYQCPKCD